MLPAPTCFSRSQSDHKCLFPFPNCMGRSCGEKIFTGQSFTIGSAFHLKAFQYEVHLFFKNSNMLLYTKTMGVDFQKLLKIPTE